MLVYGSETNVTKNFVHNVIAKQWKEKHGDNDNANAVQLEIEMGDEMAERWDEVTHENYDYLVVATSSYAEGDPPTGFGRFLYRLQNTTERSDGDAPELKPLYGLQHAVLGVGNTQYDTFQNIPRHVDMYLSKCGSRRCKQRMEWDEMENTEADVSKWAEEMMQVILKGFGDNESSKTQPDVCTWEEPANDLFEKKVGEEGWEDVGRTQTEISPWMMIVGVLVFIVGAWYNYKFGESDGEELTNDTMDGAASTPPYSTV